MIPAFIKLESICDKNFCCISTGTHTATQIFCTTIKSALRMLK